MRFGVEHADLFEGCRRVQLPVPRQHRFLDEGAADPQLHIAPLLVQRRGEVAQEQKAVGDDVGDVGAPVRHGVAAVEPLAQAEAGPAAGGLRPAVEGFGAHDRRHDLQLRQPQPEIAAEQPRPDATGQHDVVAADAALFGDDPADPAAFGFHPAHGASGQDRGTQPARGLGDRGGGLGRFGPPVAGGEQGARPGAGEARQHARHLLAGQQAAVELEGTAGLVQPGLAFGQILLRLAQIDDAAAAEAGLGSRQGVEFGPEPQRLDRQRDFQRVAAHLAAPAPIAAGLFGGDLALLAQHDRDAFAGQEERGAGADDAAAHDHHAGPRRQIGIGGDGIDAGGHAVSNGEGRSVTQPRPDAMGPRSGPLPGPPAGKRRRLSG